jgi:two-component system response regulator HydG
MNIEKMVTEKVFRQDLLYRINTIELDLPPLRDVRRISVRWPIFI